MGANAALALSAFNTVSQYGSLQRQATASSAMGQYQAKVLRENAQLSDEQAEDAVELGQVEEQRSRALTRQQIATTRSSYAGQGVDVGSGSAVDVQSSEAGLGELDALTIRNNAAREAWGYKVEAVNDRQQAALAQYGGESAAAGYRAESYGTLLTGALNTYGIYQRNANDRADRRTSPYRTGKP